MTRLRLMAYNVHGFRAGVRRVAQAVAAELPDIALLNEVRWPGRLRAFARLMGMNPVSGVRVFGGVPNAVLLRPPWRGVRVRIHHFARRGPTTRRGLVAVQARRAGLLVTAVAVHLGLSDAERVRHARELTDLVAGTEPPVLVGGDLNESPDAPAVSWVAERLWDAQGLAGEGPGLTFPSPEPRARVDYLFVSEGIRVERCWVGAGPEFTEASDHLPVFADVVVGEGHDPRRERT